MAVVRFSSTKSRASSDIPHFSQLIRHSLSSPESSAHSSADSSAQVICRSYAGQMSPGPSAGRDRPPLARPGVQDFTGRVGAEAGRPWLGWLGWLRWDREGRWRAQPAYLVFGSGLLFAFGSAGSPCFLEISETR